jgi:hypothetical protein
MPSSCVVARLRTLLVSSGFLLLFVPALHAQESLGEAAAFPRQMLTWYLGGEAERVWEHAGPMLRELAGSAQGLREASEEIVGGMGPETRVLKEQLFDHPEGGGAKVYVRAVRHANVPEMFWIVTFFPAERKVQMIMPQPRQTVRALFPQVELP